MPANKVFNPIRLSLFLVVPFLTFVDGRQKNPRKNRRIYQFVNSFHEGLKPDFKDMAANISLAREKSEVFYMFKFPKRAGVGVWGLENASDGGF